jgi:hypothetical protein
LSNRFPHNINIEEVCNGIAHTITKDMISKYTKLMEDPALKGLWVPAMSKELHCLAQGKEGVKVGTNTIFYLTHDETRCIPKDRIVTYTRIVINHRPQKENSNCVHITVGSNLIDYLCKLLTQTADMVSAKKYVEQCHQYSRSQIWGHRHQENVSQNLTQLLQVHANAPQALSR